MKCRRCSRETGHDYIHSMSNPECVPPPRPLLELFPNAPDLARLAAQVFPEFYFDSAGYPVKR